MIRFTTSTLSSITLVALTGFSACDRKNEQETAQEAQEARSTEKPEAGPAAEETEQGPVRPIGNPVPIGPRLVIVPGKGLSAIRFGATKETVQRHMEAPCDIVTEDSCIYVKQAVQFHFDDEGALDRIKVQRRDRLVPGHEDKAFGMFKGLLPPTIMLGLHRHVVLEEYEEPEKKEPVKLEGETGLVDRHYYDGMVLEYDKIENGNVVLSAFEITPSDTAEELTLPVPVKQK